VSLGDGVPYRTITVPLDGSAVAEQALHPAQTIAAATGAALVLLSVAPSAASIPPVEGAGVIPPWTAGEFQAQTEQLAAYLVEKARELEAGGQVVRAKLVKGSPDEAILHAGDEEHADLIVMATHGRSGLQRLWLGSVARKVTQGTRLPVLLVRAQPA
jgi:nucleotide-binding universal stress UspA family protein